MKFTVLWDTRPCSFVDTYQCIERTYRLHFKVRRVHGDVHTEHAASKLCLFLVQQPPVGSSFTRFLDHTQRHITIGRTPLEEWSARGRHLYLTTHNTQNRQTSMAPVGFEPTISAGERPQTYDLDRAATGTSFETLVAIKNIASHPRRRLHS